ncbi:hypothetical protein HOF65_00665 [bacterium]|nr:hypothetical protein [bacterium]MBT4632725.1 hypothetical protein [bacterium]MBT6778575.1 hypothetical protein [bacterium]
MIFHDSFNKLLIIYLVKVVFPAHKSHFKKIKDGCFIVKSSLSMLFKVYNLLI